MLDAGQNTRCEQHVNEALTVNGLFSAGLTGRTTDMVSWYAWLSLVSDQQLIICACSVIADHTQISS